jgi:hypothetical protein
MTPIAASAALLLALAARPATAQARSRTGLWMNALAGYGRLKLTCSTCSDAVHANGTAMALAVGGTPGRGLLLGVEAQVWIGANAGVDQRVSSLNLVAQWYPLEAGLYIRGGTGLANGRVAPADTSATHTAANGSGIALVLGAGFDLAVSRRIALTVDAGTQITALGDLVVPGLTADDTIAYITRLSVGVTLR